MDPDALAKAFVEHYYSTFDSNRAGLATLYQEASMLTFEGQKIQGAQNIVAKLAGLPFQQCKHHISTVDCQPSGPAGDVPFDAYSTRKLLCVQRYFPLELRLTKWFASSSVCSALVLSC